MCGKFGHFLLYFTVRDLKQGYFLKPIYEHFEWTIIWFLDYASGFVYGLGDGYNFMSNADAPSAIQAKPDRDPEMFSPENFPRSYDGTGSINYANGYSNMNGNQFGISFGNGYAGGRYPIGMRNPYASQWIASSDELFRNPISGPFFPAPPFINAFIGLDFVGRKDKYQGHYQIYNGEYDGYIAPTTTQETTTTNQTVYG